jgi:hypothetical protein
VRHNFRVNTGEIDAEVMDAFGRAIFASMRRRNAHGAQGRETAPATMANIREQGSP